MLSLESGPKRSRDEDTGGEVEDDGTTKGVMKAMHMNVDQSECEQHAHVEYQCAEGEEEDQRALASFLSPQHDCLTLNDCFLIMLLSSAPPTSSASVCKRNGRGEHSGLSGI